MQNYNNDVLYAGFFTRFSAYLIDSIIVGVALMAIELPKFFIGIMKPDIFFIKPLLFKFSLLDIIVYLLSLAYFVLTTYFFGATLGKKLLKIKVCKGDNNKLSFVDVLYRESIGRYLSSIIIFIGYIMIGVDSKKRGLHDILCDTLVVYDFKQNNKNYANNDPGMYIEKTSLMESKKDVSYVSDQSLGVISDDVKKEDINND